MEAALAEGSPKVHEAGNKSFVWPFAQGDLDAAFRDAPVVVERTYRQQRLIPEAMEPRAVVCQMMGDEFTLWSATQIPHVLRFLVAAVPRVSRRRSCGWWRRTWAAGSGPSSRSRPRNSWPAPIARKLGRLVEWTESRSEGNLAVHHGRDQLQRIKVAADRDGPGAAAYPWTCWSTWAPT